MTMADATGTVSRSLTEERLPGATVEAKKGTETSRELTDEHGEFTFVDLEDGTWSFVALEENSIPNPARTLKHPDETTDISISLLRKEGNRDRVAGLVFFVGLLLTFGVLVALYIVLHVIILQKPVPLSTTIPVAISALEEQVAAAVNAEDKVSAGPELLAAFDDIATDVETALEQRQDMSETDRLLVTARVKAIRDSLAGDKVEETLAEENAPKLAQRIDTLRDMIEAPGPRTVGIWDRDPLRIIEVLLWGLAGILVNKIITTGWWLRRRTFYQEGIIMHVAHVIATPVMVLVVVFLLSLVTLKLTLAGGNELALDLSDPRVMVGVSFLLGTIPWPLWDFIEDTAKRFPGGIS
jgi:hypothetical protein